MERETYIPADDSALEALDDKLLQARLAHHDWKTDPQVVPDEQVFRLFRRAKATGHPDRVGLLSRELGQRMLSRAKGFAYRSGISRSFGSPDQAAEEISQYVWERLIKQPKDAAYAEKSFGQLFKRRALDFQRRLLAKKRSRQVSLDAMAHVAVDEQEDPDLIVRKVLALRQDSTPLDALETKRRAAQAAVKLQEVLTKNEHLTFVMLFVHDMKVKEVSAALGVCEKSVNNYKNAALKKIRKEFKP
jgi:RNA polymerase sigma factor (sigma-70 family)